MRCTPNSSSASRSSRRASSRSSWRSRCRRRRWTSSTSPRSRRTSASMYGDSETGRRMLVARRLVENGVRFVQVWAGGWDHHTDVKGNLRKQAENIDQPIGALLQGSQAARHAQGHAGRLGRRIRPHPAPRQGRARRTRTRPSPQGVLLVDGRRRRQGRPDLRRRPTSSATMSWTTRSTSTTCTRRSFISSASITRSSPIATTAAISVSRTSSAMS